MPASHSPDAETLTGEDAPSLEMQDKGTMLGRIIDRRYRIDSIIGAGGMGVVYRATRILIGDEVAIKILHPEQLDAQASGRFRREAQATARLKHPNAVSIYDFGVSTDGRQYLVMELVEGESLREVSKRDRTLGLSAISDIVSQVCGALDEAHRCHIIHRDIKPDNIILNTTPSGLRVKVLDFGIAKLRDETASHLTQTGSVMGTPHYMSPEQCLGEELDPRSDIYSLGIVVYELLCGRVPFNSPVSTAVVVQHVSQPAPSLHSLNPAVPLAIEAVVLHALEKSRDARPSTAGEFAEELRSALLGANIPAVPFAAIDPVVASSFPQVIEANEETVERVSSPQSALPKTVHLASPHLGVSRTTGGTSPAALTTSVRRAVPYKYVGLAVAAVALIGFLIYWLQPGARSIIQNNSTPESTPAETATSTITPASAETQPTVSNAPPPQMAPVRGGSFMMGSSATIEDQDSKPSHMVTVKSFFIDVNEVTCEEYKKFIDETGHPAPGNWINRKYPAGAAHRPVTFVSWEDANAYARWAGKRLPTEEEWEFAARGPNKFLYPWGNDWKSGCANADEEGRVRGGMVNVGTYKCASPYGVLDMIGNAWEWTSSNWAPYPGGRLREPGRGGEKVIRGGSWQSPRDVTASFRLGWIGPGDQTGFRCAKDMAN